MAASILSFDNTGATTNTEPIDLSTTFKTLAREIFLKNYYIVYFTVDIGNDILLSIFYDKLGTEY
jgi:hypothetical protein